MVMLVNEDFVEIAKLMAKSKGVPNLPHVVFPRTINTIPDEEVVELTGKVVDEIASLLMKGA